MTYDVDGVFFRASKLMLALMKGWLTRIDRLDEIVDEVSKLLVHY